MMSILHGESLPQCLVSVAECRKQTEALKLGMCKTFQYSQELTGRSTRQSERLAAKRRAKLDQGESSSANIGQMDNFSDLHQTCVNFKGNAGSPSKPSSASTQPFPPHPPPAPPLPPLLTSQVKSCHSPDVSAKVTRATVLASVNNTQLTAMDNNGNPAGSKKASTPSEQVCKAENQENDSANFVTPMLTKRILRHKRSSSNSSTGSNSSQLSLANVHLELKSSNPLTRLRSTQVNRSPGGTPVRVPGEYQPTEPLHKALLSAMKAKFKNVSTPSPGRRSAAGSGRASAASSVSTSANNSSFGVAQSP
ncbi:hypothetical protein PoB_002768500 [Plakobranchus ocellatus]|uniref:Uncharacterized protein n=1 Tax=Plakobranchus ocellatus TaxID=259542 RepID=A0AAV3ZZ88_9GAST|nr:hypothetical protein PoB_002768500 [Plakobranchus ocellatus]